MLFVEREKKELRVRVSSCMQERERSCYCVLLAFYYSTMIGIYYMKKKSQRYDDDYDDEDDEKLNNHNYIFREREREREKKSMYDNYIKGKRRTNEEAREKINIYFVENISV